MNKNNLYRLSALMYPDSNSTLSRDNIIKKIIESYFIMNDNLTVTLEELPKLIKDNFNFSLTGGEIGDIVCESDDFIVTKTGKYNQSDKCQDLNMKLTVKRYELLKERENNNNIYVFIDKFYESKIIDTHTVDEVKQIIESFLYKVFVQNVEKSKQLFNNELDISSFVEKQEFADKDKKVINQFLDYDDPLKNKAIFDIGCLAIEYISINGDVNLASQLNNVTSKVLYLDTNIMFRLLGINGDLRSKRMHDFLLNCKKHGQELRITKAAEEEFHKSLDYSLKQLEPISDKRMYSEPLQEEDDVISHYFDLKNNGKVISIDLYKHEIYNKYDEFIKNLSIVIEDENFYDICKGKERTEIDEITEDIKDFKRFTSIRQAKVDASNIYQIRNLRSIYHYNFNETRFFLVTADRKLEKWDKLRSTSLPITVFPSDWLSVMLKYVSRTEDDYKSFVSFIKTVIHENHIDKDKTLAVLDGISDLTDNLGTQKYIYDKFVSEHVKDIVDLSDYPEVYDKAKCFADFTLQNQLKEMQGQLEDVKCQSVDQNDKIDELTKNSENERNKSKREKEKTFNIIKESTKKNYWREMGWLVVCAVLGLYITVMLYFFQEAKFNFIVPLIVNLQEPQTPQYDVLVTRITLVPFIILVPTICKLIKNLFGDGKLNKRIEKLEYDIKS